MLLLLSGCERPPVVTQQQGYRGTGMVAVSNPRTLEAQADLHAVPPMSEPARARANAPTAGKVYKNIQVLQNVSLAEFGRTMAAMTEWVAGAESCNYCHVEGNFEDESKYTKIVARRMLQMVQQVNSQWPAHVGSTGVTCYTCHRGQPLPAERWFNAAEANSPFALSDRGTQNRPASTVGLASLPSEPFAAYLVKRAGADDIRIASQTALPADPQPADRRSIQQTESTYGLMMHMSEALGVNCSFCHNSRAFSNWSQSSPQRVTAYHGIRMVREINSDYLDPLGGVFPMVPPGRLGPTSDAAKVNCTTCHQGINKPLRGVPMAKNYPALLAPTLTPAADTGKTETTAGRAEAGAGLAQTAKR